MPLPTATIVVEARQHISFMQSKLTHQ